MNTALLIAIFSAQVALVGMFFRGFVLLTRRMDENYDKTDEKIENLRDKVVDVGERVARIEGFLMGPVVVSSDPPYSPPSGEDPR